MGVHLVRGVTATEMFCHYLGKVGGPMDGRDGNIHLGAYDRGTIPMISHLPEMLPVGLGVALARSRRGQPSAAIGFCGDGASAGGVFHETLNLAALWDGPLVIVLERNGYANMTPESKYLPIDALSKRAAGYGIPSATVDGNDVRAVYRAVSKALDRAREGDGPTLIEAFTFRMNGHGAHDGQAYVPDEELELWSSRDPLAKWAALVESECGWNDTDQASLSQRVTDEVAGALEEALAAPFPPAHELEQSVYAP